EKFIDGATRKGVSSKVAQNLFEQMIKFAEYCFNKSHSTAYAYVSYQTAYLKANYPVEYMSALLTANSGDQDKVQKYIANCQRLKIEVEPPDINRSQVNFTPLPKSSPEETKGKILFGLSAVKNLGEGAIMEILKAREEDGNFTSLAELCDRVNKQALNSRALEALIGCGAFDRLEANRKKLTVELPAVIAWAQKRNRDRDTGQLSLFDGMMAGAEKGENAFESAPEKTGVVDFSAQEKLEKEKDLLGFYVSDHPLKQILEANPVEGAVTIADLKEKKAKKAVKVVAMVAGIKLHTTKKGDRMAFLQIEDLTGQMEAIVFPKTFEEVGPLLEKSGALALLLTGKAETKDEEVQLLVDGGKQMAEEMAEAVEKNSPIEVEGEPVATTGSTISASQTEMEFQPGAKAISGNPASQTTVEVAPEEVQAEEIEPAPESEHPAKLARGTCGDPNLVLLESLEGKGEKSAVKAIGLMTRTKIITTRKGDEMAFIEIEDETGKVDVTVFPRTYERFKHLLGEEEEETLLLVSGKTEKRDDRAKLVAEKIELVRVEESPPEEFPRESDLPAPPPEESVARKSVSAIKELAIVLELTPQQVADEKILGDLKMILEEYSPKPQNGVIPIVAIVRGKSCRQQVRFDRRFWVETPEVINRLKQLNFKVSVSHT
ncbi:MAG: OB-fold nucleic acid binding domain-containing protein, partial [Cyanobacteriota bacterium]|nr:OB-fold nucleic acid binding domain-containing protein [Cyanobacteriota bacterium]